MTNPLPSLAATYAALGAARRTEDARLAIRFQAQRRGGDIYAAAQIGDDAVYDHATSAATRSLLLRLEAACGCRLRHATGYVDLGETAPDRTFGEPMLFRVLRLLAAGHPERAIGADGEPVACLLLSQDARLTVWFGDGGAETKASALFEAGGLGPNLMRRLIDDALKELVALFGRDTTVRLELRAGGSAHAGLAARAELARILGRDPRQDHLGAIGRK